MERKQNERVSYEEKKVGKRSDEWNRGGRDSWSRREVHHEVEGEASH